MHGDLDQLEKDLLAATGSNRCLDAAIARSLDAVPAGDPTPEYTSSVQQCLQLLVRVLPDWHWHIGYCPRGIMPYVTLNRAGSEDAGLSVGRVEVIAPTVPLALLRAMVQALKDSSGAMPNVPIAAP